MKFSPFCLRESSCFTISSPLLTAFFVAVASMAHAAELGAISRRLSWPTKPGNLFTYQKGGAGIVTDSAAEYGLSTHASASFHTLSSMCSAIGNTGGFGKYTVGANAYWFDQITISSPTVPQGTIGTIDFTLFFRGSVYAGPSVSTQSGSYSASAGYSWASANVGEGGDGQPDLDVGDSYFRRVDVYSSYSETTGPDFFNQPRLHTLTFRYGVPFDFTIVTYTNGNVWINSPSTARMQIQLTGWNGFRNAVIRTGPAVTDAVFASQTGFNYGAPGSTSFEQWAASFQQPPTSMDADPNQNGLPNLLEFALGRDPLEPSPAGNPLVAGRVTQAGVTYPSASFTRPILGFRPSGVTYTPQRSSSLGGGWSSLGVVSTTAPNPANEQTEIVTVRSTQPIGSQYAEWIRLEVTKD